MKKIKSTIPKRTRDEISIDPLYRVCSLRGYHGHICGGRITREHAIRVAGRNIQEKWAIIPLCAKGHDVDQFQDSHSMKKDLNEWVALCRTSEAGLRAIFNEAGPPFLSKASVLIKRREYLIGKYGVWNPPAHTINYHSLPIMDKAYII